MENRVFKRRVYFAAVLITVISFVFIARLFSLHFSSRIIINNKRKAPVRRGIIADRNGHILAMSIVSYSLFINPEKVKNSARTASLLAEALGISEGFIVKRLNRDKRFVWIRRKLDGETAARIRAMKLPGVGFKKEFRRVFPNGSLAANIIGFVNVDNRGIEGLEYLYDNRLAGRGEAVAGDGMGGLVYGQNIVLTIDRTVQHYAEKAIADAVRVNAARQGAVVVMEVKTGRILALAKSPGFDPYFYYRYTPFQRNNFSITSSFEPGSTMKVIAVASVLEKRPELLRKRYFCNGKVEIGDAVITCTGKHGSVSVNEIIKHSCNSGIIEIMKKMKRSDFYKTLDDFGFGRQTGIELPGESEGILRKTIQWSGLSKYSMAIGYEISVNSLQLAAAFSAIANKGVYLRPQIIDSIESHDGKMIQSFFSKSRGRVISATTARGLMRLMRLAVREGTGKKASSRWYSVAGKTGTSQKYISRKGYTSKRAVSSFVGIVPVMDPAVCMVVVVDEPKGSLGGGDVAAPVFSRLADRVLPLLGVGSRRTKAPPMKRSRAVKVKAGREMPDFRGLSVEALPARVALLQKTYGVKVKIYGSGVVISQKPLPGKRVKPGDFLILQCRQ